MKILFLNGPPGSGKDYIAGALPPLLPNLTFTSLKFADPLKDAYCRIRGFSRKWLEKNKNLLAIPASNYTHRDALITLSETYIKKNFGQDFLGHRLLERLIDAEAAGFDVAIISDSGFAAEASPIVRYMRRGRCAVVRVHKADTSFSRDSRSYWEPKDQALKFFDLYNPGNPDTLKIELEKDILRWLQS